MVWGKEKARLSGDCAHTNWNRIFDAIIELAERCSCMGPTELVGLPDDEAWSILDLLAAPRDIKRR